MEELTTKRDWAYLLKFSLIYGASILMSLGSALMLLHAIF